MRRKITKVIEDWDTSGREAALLILGARQVGKTYAVTEYGRRVYGDGFLCIDFSDAAPEVLRAFEGDLSKDSLIERLSAVYRGFRFIPGKTLIFLDEIQLCPNARTAVRPLVRGGEYRVIASGSLLGIRMREVRLNPVGYMERAEMHPMDFEEFLWALDMPQNVIDRVRRSISDLEPIEEPFFTTFTELFSRYMVVGGMPKAVKLYTETKRFTDLHLVFDELFGAYQDDVDLYADAESKIKIKSCFRSIPSMLAQENKKFVFGRVGSDEGTGFRSTGFRYFAPALEWLEMARLVNVCNNVTEPKRPLAERVKLNSFKLYMLDTGLLVSRYDDSLLTEVLFGNPDVNAGAIGENAVAQAFTAQGRRLLYFSHDDPRMEVDFLTVIGGRLCGIEVKTGSKRRCSSLNRLMSQYNASGVMFETRNVFEDEKGVRHYPLFAASFMDAIDPVSEAEDDLSFLDAVIGKHSE